MCANFGNISVLITQILPKQTVKYLYLQLFYFSTTFSKKYSISSRFWSKSSPSRWNLAHHLRSKDPSRLDLSMLPPNNDSIVLALLTPTPDSTNNSSNNFKILLMFDAFRSSLPSIYSRKMVRSSAYCSLNVCYLFGFGKV